MACGVADFEAYIRERLAHSKSEAARVVLEFVEKDRVSMGDAVLLAIEALPMRQTKELRHIVDLFESWCEWYDKWRPRGWKIAVGHDGVAVAPPKKFDHRDDAYPRFDVIEAAAGVALNPKLKAHHGPMAACPNCIEFDFK